MGNLLRKIIYVHDFNYLQTAQLIISTNLP